MISIPSPALPSALSHPSDCGAHRFIDNGAIPDADSLVREFMPMARRIAYRRVPPSLASHRDDAIQEAMCVLLELSRSDRLKTDQNIKSYAGTAMANRITDYLREHSNAARGERFGRGLARVRKYLRESGDDLECLTDDNIAQAVGLPHITVKQLRPWVRDVVRLDAPAGDDAERTSAVALVGVEEPTSREWVMIQDDVEQLRALMCLLDVTDRIIVEKVFGLRGDAPCSIAAAAQKLGISRQRAAIRFRRSLAQVREAWVE